MYGGQAAPMRGGVGGNAAVLVLGPDERITSVRVEIYNDGGNNAHTALIGQMAFTTNMGVTRSYGSISGGTVYVVSGSELRWISGIGGNALYRIQFNFQDGCEGYQLL